MTPFLSLPPPSQIISPLFPPLSVPATQATLTTPFENIAEVKVQVTLPRLVAGTFAAEVTQITANTVTRSCSVTGKCHEIALLLRKSLLLLKHHTIVFNIINSE